jgi:hypothetical protein
MTWRREFTTYPSAQCADTQGVGSCVLVERWMTPAVVVSGDIRKRQDVVESLRQHGGYQ